MWKHSSCRAAARRCASAAGAIFIAQRKAQTKFPSANIMTNHGHGKNTLRGDVTHAATLARACGTNETLHLLSPNGLLYLYSTLATATARRLQAMIARIERSVRGEDS